MKKKKGMFNKVKRAKRTLSLICGIFNLEKHWDE